MVRNGIPTGTRIELISLGFSFSESRWPSTPGTLLLWLTCVHAHTQHTLSLVCVPLECEVTQYCRVEGDSVITKAELTNNLPLLRCDQYSGDKSTLEAFFMKIKMNSYLCILIAKTDEKM